MAKTLHFASPAAYKKWLAFGQMHGKFRHHGGRGTPKIMIAGKAHRVSHSNPAELVVFGNPSNPVTDREIALAHEKYLRAMRKEKDPKRRLSAATKRAWNRYIDLVEAQRGTQNPTWMRVNGVTGRLVDVRGDTPATIEYQLEKKDGTKVWVKPRYAPQTIDAKKNSSRRKNPHHRGCNCAICKNARGEKHAPGCGCAICQRKRNGGRKNPSVIMHRANPKKRTRRRRNQSDGDEAPSTEAVQLYQAFQGKDPAGVIERQVSDTIRSEYVCLGDLEYLLVRPDGGDKDVKVDFDGDKVKLASSPDGAQLYLIGGNQNLTNILDKFGADASKDFVELGSALEVQYLARKAQGNYEPVSYFHKFGEESDVVPLAIFDQLKKQVFLVGGEYRVEAPGIVN